MLRYSLAEISSSRLIKVMGGNIIITDATDKKKCTALLFYLKFNSNTSRIVKLWPIEKLWGWKPTARCMVNANAVAGS